MKLNRGVIFGTLILGACLLGAGLTGHPTRAWAGPIDPGFVRLRTGPVISPWSARLIDEITVNNRVKIWVFFTDKGFYDERGMEAARVTTGTALRPRAAARRAKIGRDRVEFIDLPLRQAYIDRIADRGADLRRRSRWLNAASFEIDADRVSDLTELPFVIRIQPMLSFARLLPPVLQAPETGGTEPDALSTMVLDYGSSFDQLEQINIPAAHALGYSGQGVLICMMDTGFRKDHSAFSQIIADGRLLDEWDFVNDDGETQDEPEDVPGHHNHGTYTWSTCGGEADGFLYGPAYGADFLLAKTEDLLSETPVEEDNWLAAVEWASALGADVISSSLSYKDWYVYDDYDGDFPVITQAADMAAALGIVVCNSIGNSGPGPGTLGAPADADSILSVGAVYSSGMLTTFSSRGPTSDGRTKPEVCAQGYLTRCANPSDPALFRSVSGTSLSCPLVAGAAAVVLSAHPTWTAMQVRDALMQTASQAKTPDNNYGWGIIDVVAAINYACVPPALPVAPVSATPAPCPNSFYYISWPPVSGAAFYELFENGSSVALTAALSMGRFHASGTYEYYVVAINTCGTSAPGPVGGQTTVEMAPPAPLAPVASDTDPCPGELFAVSWDVVPGAVAYELYEGPTLVYTGSDAITMLTRTAGTFTYSAVAVGSCESSPTGPAGPAVTLHDCGCHGDPLCDGSYDVLDVVHVVSEAFRNTQPITDATCPHFSRNDTDCDCAVTVLDVVRLVEVAFRNADAAIMICDGCTQPCP